MTKLSTPVFMALASTIALGSGCTKTSPHEGKTKATRPSAEVPASKPKLCVKGDRFGDAERAALIRTADPATLSDVADLESRIKTISESFASKGDWRGLFPAMYEIITETAAADVSREPAIFKDPEAAKKVTLDFGRIFLVNLHAHLTGGELTPYWQAYYRYATECSESALTIVGTGANSHLSIDLAHATATADDSFREDFVLFGDALFGSQIEMLDNLESKFGVDARPFFRGFFAGKVIDGVAGEGSTSRFGFQVIRTEAWSNSRLLRDRVLAGKVQAAMNVAWTSRDIILRQLR